jgi:hypothetical protein
MVDARSSEEKDEARENETEMKVTCPLENQERVKGEEGMGYKSCQKNAQQVQKTAKRGQKWLVRTKGKEEQTVKEQENPKPSTALEPRGEKTKKKKREGKKRMRMKPTIPTLPTLPSSILNHLNPFKVSQPDRSSRIDTGSSWVCNSRISNDED